MPEPFRVLLVNAVHAGVEVETRYPHLGLAYLAASVRRDLPDAGVEFRIVEGDVQAATEAFKPALVGLSSVSQNFDLARTQAEFFASRGIPVTLGGVHVSVLPQGLPPTVQAACLGEGERTFVDLVAAAIDGKLSSAIPDIPGLAYRDGDELRLTKSRPMTENLDELPMPARDLLPIRRHTYMFTSRGCPFRCAFCASSRYWNKVRFFSAEYVVDEIELLMKTYGVDLVSFFDDLFAANRPRLKEILDLLDRRRMLGKVRFTMNCRADLMDQEMVELLARMGVVSIGMGLESGDDETLKFLKGSRASVARNRQAVECLKQAGIAANASFIVGSPKETREQAMRTYHFIRRSKLDLFDVYLLTPYPGTPVWDDAKRRGLVSDDMDDWSRLDVNVYRDPTKAIVVSETMTTDEVLRLYRKFRRLRLRWNLMHVWRHPLARDIPRMALKLVGDFFVRLFRRRRGGS